MNESNIFWINKKAKIEILKDNKKLIYTATVLDLTDLQITFKDRDGEIFSFNTSLIQQMQQLWGDK